MRTRVHVCVPLPVALVLGLSVLLTGCDEEALLGSAPAVTAEALPVDAPPQSALATATLLPVKGRAPKTGYDRDLYGHAWKDVDRNGCDTRNDILRRDLTEQVLKDGTNGCVVLAGTLADPYSGLPIAFVRGQATSSDVQIDHVVALSDSWQKGAQQWDTPTREAFANDPLNLLAADGPLNQQKGDGDTATWLPPNDAFRCAYVARQVGVKYTYGLWVTQAERDAMVRVLSTCPTQPLPAGALQPAQPVAAP
ncbi:HNH endonuclease family protein [Cellulomonas sp. Leaf334]|uniref:HNH endonuclease family protein n=1 Tax=Cellulomonas sp. Leaf334 TaxID=1736339 RepID=UPI0035133569